LEEDVAFGEFNKEMRTRILYIALMALAGGLLSCTTVEPNGSAAEIGPAEFVEQEVPFDPAKLRTAVFAGGCFWGVEAVFEHTRGVAAARSGYAGGTAETADYDKVSEGKTGHAEAVEVSYDPERVSFGQLLDIFFKVAHNPTELNRQGPDIGPQYRSAFFYADDEQKNAVEAYIEKLNAAKVYRERIVTQIVPLERFYEAEAYHQDYLPRNLTSPYIVYHDLPKLDELKKKYPTLFIDRLKGRRTARR
jgi:peptide-methionine (S)-S-oxide reductase